MAEKPRSFSDRLREREDEEEAESQRLKEERDLAARRSRVPGSPSGAGGGILSDVEDIKSTGATDKLHELLERIEPLMEQVHQLYNQYFSGLEKRPPLERRKQLDQAMEMIALLPKSTSSLQFKCSTVRTRYMSFAEQWDRKIRQLESQRRGR
jgi:hypothetical protein